MTYDMLPTEMGAFNQAKFDLNLLAVSFVLYVTVPERARLAK